MHTTQARFLALSIAIHVLAFFLIQPHRMSRPTETEAISVSLLPQAETSSNAPKLAPTPAPREPPARRAPKSPAVVAKKDAWAAPEAPAPLRESLARVETKREEPAPPQPISENTVVVERPLPTLKELLPPATWTAGNERAGGPVSLNTKDPIYVSYFTKIKQTIEQQWEYPEVALRYGLQGRLSLEFTISGNGQLENLRMIRSSGSQVLDQEALRAIMAASPFPPIPAWIKPVPLSISASMEYHDNRLNYRFNR
jgi:protein TonB